MFPVEYADLQEVEEQVVRFWVLRERRWRLCRERRLVVLGQDAREGLSNEA